MRWPSSQFRIGVVQNAGRRNTQLRFLNLVSSSKLAYSCLSGHGLLQVQPMISSTSSRPEGAARKLKVFVSYSRRDIEFADRIVEALQDRGLEVLIDRRDLP